MKTLRLTFVLFVLLCSSCASAVPATGLAPAQPSATWTVTPSSPTVTPQPFRSLNMIKIQAPSLADNLVGEPTERTIYVYLPPSYGSSEKRYPVVYYLPGYGDSSILDFQLPDDMDSLIESGQVKEMIVVVASGDSKMGGSFYVNSTVTGNWEDHIVHDVVDYVDSHFRTLPQAESRGITGHSMGGFGALNIAMHHPEVFGAVYSMSPCLFDENGLAESFMFAQESLIRQFVEFEAKLASLPLEQAQRRMFAPPEEFSLAYG